VSGFVLVIAAFVTGTLLAKRGTQLATQELERVRLEIAPMTRTARQLGESAATFDRAVLASLGTDLPQYRVDLVEAAERLALHINRTRREHDEGKKRSYIQRYIPHIGIALQQILKFSDAERERTVATLTKTLERSRSGGEDEE
jgi:hypothetical protein